MPTLSTCLWFDGHAEEAATFYVSLFPNARILETTHYPHGSVLIVRFELEGQVYLALNGGPHYTLTPACSLVATCDTQAEVDALWQALCEGGQESRCGWLTDRFGVSWQVVPRALPRLLHGPDPAGSQRAIAAMMTMSKLDLPALQRAYDGS